MMLSNNNSTIFKRHETRNKNLHRQQPVVKTRMSLTIHDNSITETIRNLTSRSTIFGMHQQRHELSSSKADASPKMSASASVYNGESVLSNMGSKSSIYNRNSRRSERWAA